jgi:hypothetical protein
MGFIDIFLEIVESMMQNTLSGEKINLLKNRGGDEDPGAYDEAIEDLQAQILEETGEWLPDDVIEDIIGNL